jgi:hypothetical protein
MTRPKRAALKRRLTELYVRKLKPKAQPFLVWDTHQRGLAIRVQPTGARGWKCIYSHHSRPRCTRRRQPSGSRRSHAAAEAMPVGGSRGKDPADRRPRGGHFRRAGRTLRGALREAPNKKLGEADKLIRRRRCRAGGAAAASISRADVRNVADEAPVWAKSKSSAGARGLWGSKQEVVETNLAVVLTATRLW